MYSILIISFILIPSIPEYFTSYIYHHVSALLFYLLESSRRSTMGERNEEEGVGEANIPLLRDQHEGEEDGDIMVETKKLWRIVGPSIFTRITIDLLDPCHHSGLCRPPWRARTRRHLYRQQRHHRLQLRVSRTHTHKNHFVLTYIIKLNL